MVAGGRPASNRSAPGNGAIGGLRSRASLGPEPFSALSHVRECKLCGQLDSVSEHEDELAEHRSRNRRRRGLPGPCRRDAVARPLRDHHALSARGRSEIGRAVPVRRRRLESGRRRHGPGALARRRDGGRHRRAEAAREPRQGWRSVRVARRRSREPLPLHPELRELADVSHARAGRLFVGRHVRVCDARAGTHEYVRGRTVARLLPRLAAAQEPVRRRGAALQPPQAGRRHRRAAVREAR